MVRYAMLNHTLVGCNEPNLYKNRLLTMAEVERENIPENLYDMVKVDPDNVIAIATENNYGEIERYIKNMYRVEICYTDEKTVEIYDGFKDIANIYYHYKWCYFEWGEMPLDFEYLEIMNLITGEIEYYLDKKGI